MYSLSRVCWRVHIIVITFHSFFINSPNRSFYYLKPSCCTVNGRVSPAAMALITYGRRGGLPRGTRRPPPGMVRLPRHLWGVKYGISSPKHKAGCRASWRPSTGPSERACGGFRVTGADRRRQRLTWEQSRDVQQAVTLKRVSVLRRWTLRRTRSPWDDTRYVGGDVGHPKAILACPR